MRKKVAKILAVVMMITSLQNISFFSLQAATGVSTQPFNFDVQPKILKEGNPYFSTVDREPNGVDDVDSALAEWEMVSNGKYTLSYYIVQGGETKQVKAIFDYDGLSVTMKTTIQDVATHTDSQLAYTQKKFVTDKWIKQNPTTSNVINYSFVVGTDVSRDNRVFNAIINNVVINNKNMTVRAEVDTSQAVPKMTYFTTGIEKGYISPFTLSLEGGDTAKQEFFNGPSNYTVTPIHLENPSSTVSKDTINSTELGSITPGIKPGVKVSFDPIKVISTSGVYEEPTASSARDVSLRLIPQYNTPATDTVGDESITLKFKPIDGQNIAVTRSTGVESIEGKVVKDVASGKLNIFLSKPENGVTYSSPIINWSELTPSMVLIPKFSLYGTSEEYEPVNKGHTYLKFNVGKANDRQVKFTIVPYNINSKATYTIRSSQWDDPRQWDDPSGVNPKLVYEYDPNVTKSQDITATVDNLGTNFYRIDVTIDGKPYTSQIIQYNPAGFIAEPSITTIKTIDNIYVLPRDPGTDTASTNDPNYPLAIGFDMKWTAPDQLSTLLQNGDLYYELMLRENKDDKDPINTPHSAGQDGYAAYSKVFKVSRDSNGKYVVETALGTAGQKNATDEEKAKLNRYNATNNEFSMENISLMNVGAPNNNWEQIEFPNTYTYINSADYLQGAQVKDSLENMHIPGNYYLSLRTVYVPKDTTKKFTYSTESNFEPISLNLVKEVVPVPTGIVCTNVTTTGSGITERIDFDYVNIENYVKKMLEPAGLRLYTTDKAEQYSGEYVFYLYSKEGALTASNIDSIQPVDVSLNGVINLNDVQINGQSAIKILRSNGIVAFKVKISDLRGGKGKIFFSGLDANQVYYLQARTKLTPTNGGTARYSLASQIFTFTSLAEIVPPNAQDKKPTAPEDFKISADGLTKNSVTLEWTPAKFEEDSDVKKTYYEFIRSDKELTNDEKAQTVEALVAANSTWIGFSTFDPKSTTYNGTDYMMTYTSKNPNWTAITPLQLSNSFKLMDDTLSPNRIYYYYVRTVCIINRDTAKSGWIMVPVTTFPVEPPVNLKVELSKTYSYDAKTETVISFDAPIPDGAAVPSNFEFEIAVRGDKDLDYKLDYPASLVSSQKDYQGTPAGYTHFVYKITGLKPNSLYNIKVRIKDKTQDISDGSSYPTSSYCDPVATRTEYDEKYAENQEKYDEFIKKFDQEVSKRSNRAYWVVEEGIGYKYRNDYMKSEISLDKQYSLEVEEGNQEAYYYIPAEAFMAASENNTILNITLGDYSASIRPYTLTEANQDITNALEQIENDSIDDYYVKINFSLQSISGTVGGQNVISPKMIIEMELVYLKSSEDDIEIEIQEALNDLATNKKNQVINKLGRKLENGQMDKDELSDIVMDAVTDLENDLTKKVKKIIDKRTKETIFVEKLDKAILLVAQVDAYAADGYYQSGDWISVEVYSAMDGFAIEADRLGSYVFTGQASLVNTVPSIAPYQSFIAKYSLTDFFTLDEYMIKTAVTKEQLYGATARLLGAQRGGDYVTYLKNQNIQGVSGLLKSQQVRQDESIYIIMQAYEKISNRSVNTIMIKNRQSVQNIGAFQPIYRNYVYAAVELKIVEPVNTSVMPSKQMTVEEIIKLLYKVQAR